MLTKLSPGGRSRLDRREKKELMARLERDAQRICARFGLRYRVLEPERANVKSRYGVCFSDGTIRIRLRHVTTGKPLKYSSLVSTLCHELAHLKHFNHGLRFRAYYAQILEWCRAEGIYQPGLQSPSSEVKAVKKAKPAAARKRAKPRGQVEGQSPVPQSAQGTLAIFGADRTEGRVAGSARGRGKRKPSSTTSTQLELFG
ncbi:MAG: YgjP-like metallopeptidase domain-containing protein [Myxococcota bacterium]